MIQKVVDYNRTLAVDRKNGTSKFWISKSTDAIITKKAMQQQEATN